MLEIFSYDRFLYNTRERRNLSTWSGVIRKEILDILSRHLHLHLSLSREGRWGTTDDFTISFLHISALHCPLGLGELHACPFPNVVFPPLFLSALSSRPFQFQPTFWVHDSKCYESLWLELVLRTHNRRMFEFFPRSRFLYNTRERRILPYIKWGNTGRDPWHSEYMTAIKIRWVHSECMTVNVKARSDWTPDNKNT